MTSHDSLLEGSVSSSASQSRGELRLAELVAMLSLAADIGVGQPYEHAQRAAIGAVLLGDLAPPQRLMTTLEEVDMSNRTIAEQYFQAITRGDIGAAVACFGPGAEFIGPMGPIPVPDGLRAFLQGYEDSFPGARFEVTNALEAGDQVVVEGIWSGKHTGAMQLPDGRKIPATHREVRAPFATVFRVRDGKIAVHRGYWDLAGFMAQLS